MITHTHKLSEDQKMALILDWINKHGIDSALEEIQRSCDSVTPSIQILEITEECPDCEGEGILYSYEKTYGQLDSPWDGEEIKHKCEACEGVGYKEIFN